MSKVFKSVLVLMLSVSSTFYSTLVMAFDYYVVNKNAAVFTQPSGQDSIAQLRAGEVLLEIDQQGEWSKVFFLSKDKQPLKGWMKTRDLTSQGDKREPTEVTDDYYLATVDNLRLRGGPGTNHEVVGRLSDQQMVKQLNRSGDWVQVKYKDTAGITSQAWVSGRYLKPAKAVTQNKVVAQNQHQNKSAPNVNSAEQSYVITGSDVNFRSGPGASYAVVGKLSKPHKVKVIASQQGWKQIHVDLKGKPLTGWIVKRYLRQDK
ncbi:SH3 domain-containing protein [Amphritea balenae]|nr:SH3 domain-containing protein [Amphritea balenae]GGK59203.1 hypothetical protein GCM10007941_06790 [Amphritea balenae]